ncbi:SpvB/TcaC N-terminal domain-containing protein [Mesonia sp.]|uniref:SpvB/TcaC N-terminal domain-containing protein n=2 Tax=Mesonia TaxID=232115 RepID=UPI000C9099E8|nr:SpvB/TcaC N-terminal domain-containing protein [Mesonia sp.]MAN26468.1 hypothetical protein [Mesonia sp.]
MAFHPFKAIRNSYLTSTLLTTILSNVIVFGQPIHQIGFPEHSYRKIKSYVLTNIEGNSSKKVPSKKEDVSTSHLIPKNSKTNQVFVAHQQLGVIGINEESNRDNPIDNFFTINLPEDINLTNYKAVLSYDLFGLEEARQTTKSINQSEAYGGQIIQLNKKWQNVEEQLSIEELNKGINTIFFNRRTNEDYQYKVKNLSIALLPLNNLEQAPTISRYENDYYLVGNFDFKNANKLEVFGKFFELKNGVVDAVVQHTTKKDDYHLPISYYNGDQFLGERTHAVSKNKGDYRLLSNNLEENTRTFHLLDERVNFDEVLSIQPQGQIASINKSRIEVSGLNFKDIRILNAELSNVTAGNFGAYRLKKINSQDSVSLQLHLKYDLAKIPAGYTPKDVRTFYFDKEKRSWKSLPVDSLDYENKIIIATTNNETDYINGVIKVPESPETGSFAPTTLKDMDFANPSAGVVSVNPPTPTNMGAATTGFPIKLPQGRNGMQPTLNVSYNSEGGNGWMGIGWNMNTPAVTLNTKWGAPRFDNYESELYSLNGSDLVLKHNGTYTNPHRSQTSLSRTSERQFYLRREGSYQKIIRHGNGTDNYYWEVTDKRGNKSFYGGYNGSVVTNAILTDEDGNIGHWALVRREDTNGNYINYTYHQAEVNAFGNNNTILAKEFYIKEIQYTLHNSSGNTNYYKVEFKRNAYTVPSVQSLPVRNDKILSARNGYLQLTDDLLTEIKISKVQGGQTETIRTYRFNYEEMAFQKQQLVKVAEYDKNGDLFYDNTFEYFEFDDNNSIINTSVVSWSNGIGPIGNQELMNRAPSGEVDNIPTGSQLGSSNSFGDSFGMRLGVGIGIRPWSTSTTVGGTINSSHVNNNIQSNLLDVNGDGLPDLVYKDGGNIKYKANLGKSNTGTPLGFGSIRTLNGLNKLSHTSSYTTGAGVEANIGGLAGAGKSWTWTKSSTDSYFLDYNGDGLLDIVKNNRILFNSTETTQGEPDYNERDFVYEVNETENSLLSGAFDQDMIDQFELETLVELRGKYPQFDHVKIWRAPYTGTININNQAELTDKNIDDDLNSNSFRLSIEKSEHNQSSGLTTIIPVGNSYGNYLILNNVGSSASFNKNGIQVDKGDKLYFRIHNLQNGYGGEVVWNPAIEYISNPFGLISQNEYIDENGVDLVNYDAIDDFIINNGEAWAVKNSITSLNIDFQLNTQDFSQFSFSDDITFKVIIDGIDSDGEVTTSVVERIYQHQNNSATGSFNNSNMTEFLSLDQNNLNYSLTFIVESDSNVDWQSLNWKPKITANNETFYPSVSYAVYSNNLNSTKYWIKSNDLPSPTISTIEPNDGESSYLKIKHDLDDIQVLGGNPTSSNPLNSLSDDDFPIKINWITKSEVNDIAKVIYKKTFYLHRSPYVDFMFNEGYFYKLTNSPATPSNYTDPDPALTEAYFSKIFSKLDIQALQADSDSRIYSAFYSQYGEVNDNLQINFEVYDDNQSEFLELTTPTIQKPFFALAPLFTGYAYKNWGQFLYNSGVKIEYDEEMNPNLDPNSITYYDGNIDIESLGNGDTLYESTEEIEEVADNLQDENNESISVNDAEVRYSLYKQNNYLGEYYNETVINSFYGFSNNTLTTYIGRFAEENIYDIYVEPSSLLEADNGVFLGLKQRTKSKGKATTGQLGLGSGTKSKSSTDVIVEYVDLNGDNYPDIVTKNKILYTTMLGNYQAESIGNDHHSGSESIDFTVGLTIPGIKPTSDPQGGEVYNPLNTNSIAGINTGDGITHNAALWIDMNGDGLNDKVKMKENSIRVKLNKGNGFYDDEIIWGDNYSNNDNENNLGSQLIISSRKKVGAGVPIGISDSFALGFGANVSTSDSSIKIIDVNSDGLPDLITPLLSGGGCQYHLNTGTGFISPKTFTSIDNIQESISYGANIFGTITGGYWFPVFIVPPAFIPVKITASVSAGFNLGTTKTQISLGDIDGDGLVDVLSDDSFGISARLNRIGKTHLLKKVNTPLGGSWEIDYVRNGNTYKLPQNKWVLEEIKTDDNFGGDSDYTFDHSLSRISYENPNYDRREREFLGYQGVKIEQLTPSGTSGNSGTTYRYTVKSYLNDNYYVKGAEYSSALYDNNDVLLSEKETFYTLMDADNPSVDLNFTNAYYNTQSITSEELDKSRLFLGVAKMISTNYEEDGGALAAEKRFTEYDGHGNITEYVDVGEGGSDSYVTAITYPGLSGLENAYGYPELISVHQNNNNQLLRQRKATYSPTNGNLTKVTTKLNEDEQNQVQLNYDNYGNLTQIIQLDNLGLNGTPFSQQISYDSDFHTYPIGLNNSFTESSTTTYDYSFGIPVFTTDMNGQSMRTRLDDRGRVVEVTGPNELALEGMSGNSEPAWTIRYEYEDEALVESLVQNLNPDEYVVDAQHAFTSTSSLAEHYAVTRHFDPAFATANSTPSTNQLITISIVDGFGKAVQLKKTHYEGSAQSGNLEWQVSGKEVKDAFGRVTQAYLPMIEGGYPSNLNSLSNATSFIAYNDGNLSTPESGIPPTTMDYDTRDRKTQITAPGSTTETLEYTIDGARWVTDYKNARGNHTKTYKDNRGRTRKTIQSDGQEQIMVAYEYNAVNELTDVVTNGQATQTTHSKYDLAGRRIEYQHPDQGASVFEYDKAGNLLKRRTSNLLTAGNQQAIEYVYDYGRLMEINYPENPENKVTYTYGQNNDPLAEEVNAVGRLLYQEDASGIQLFGYGKMGELTKNLRSVDVAGRHSYYFYTAWEYDSWNRVQKITYPDGEEVSYHYNLGGELQSITSEIDGLSNPSTQPDIVQDIIYNGYGERLRIAYGNGTATNFHYDPRRRMDNLHHFFANNFDIEKVYEYDNNSNVTKITTNDDNNGLSLNGELSGPSNYTYNYDGFDRLIHAEGIYTGPNDLPGGNYLQQQYKLDMEYDTQNSHTILSKTQTHQFGIVSSPGAPMSNIQTNLDTHYSLSYEEYGQGAEVAGSVFWYTQPHAPTKMVQKPDENCCGNSDDPRIQTQYIDYDANGNQLEITKEVGEEQFSLRKNLWDEENRLLAVDLNPEGDKYRPIAAYTYDAGGERIIKYNINRIEAYSNAKSQGHTQENNTMMYPSGLVTARPYLDKKRERHVKYTKHYYAGSQRVASKIGTAMQLGVYPIFVSQNIITNFDVESFKDKGIANTNEASTKLIDIYSTFEVSPPNLSPAPYQETVSSYHHQFDEGASLEMFYFHSDHLGSSNFITNIVGEISQHIGWNVKKTAGGCF